MFIKNPNKKESYSFRVKPELLENIKNYAKATNQTVPEILNDLIEEKTKGLHLTNDYLPKGCNENIIISIPPLEELRNENLDLLNNNNSSNILEVKQISNNLDIWTDTEGYKSSNRDLKHEGIEFVLLPDLILQAGYHIVGVDGLLSYCLIPIYFRVTKSNKLIISNVHINTALNMIKKSQNLELLDIAKAYEYLVNDTIRKYTNLLKNASFNESEGTYYTGGFTYINYEELLKDLWSKLLVELDDIKPDINTTVVTHLDGAIERTTTMEELLSTTLVSDNPYLLWNEIDELKDELKTSIKENEDLKKENEDINQKLTDLQQQVTQMAKVWAEISKEENTTKTNESKQ